MSLLDRVIIFQLKSCNTSINVSVVKEIWKIDRKKSVYWIFVGWK